MTDPDRRDSHSYLFPDVLARISGIFGDHFAEVLESYRALEALTSQRAFESRQNLLEAFSHLGVLFGRAEELAIEQQLEQVSLMEDHLRRVLMEGFESQVYAELARIRNDWGYKSTEESPPIGRMYDVRAAPLIREGRLLGHVSPSDVETRRDRILQSVSAARSAKVADGDWEDWTRASQDFASAAIAARDLGREMGAAVDAANEIREARHQWWTGMLGSAVAGGIIGYGLPYVIHYL